MNIVNIDKYFHEIIDELHPLLKAISDEICVEEKHNYGVYIRDFQHKNGKKFRIRWRVYYGTPETVRTVFEPAVEI